MTRIVPSSYSILSGIRPRSASSYLISRSPCRGKSTRKRGKAAGAERRGDWRKRRCKPHLREAKQGGARRNTVRDAGRDWRPRSPAWPRVPFTPASLFYLLAVPAPTMESINAHPCDVTLIALQHRAACRSPMMTTRPCG